jgi:hypothetical protein
MYGKYIIVPTIIHMKTHAQTLLLGASSKTESTIYKIDEVTTGVLLSTGTSPTTESTNSVKSS